MIEMTTNNSINVKPARGRVVRMVQYLLQNKNSIEGLPTARHTSHRSRLVQRRYAFDRERGEIGYDENRAMARTRAGTGKRRPEKTQLKLIELRKEVRGRAGQPG
jgi:hypothetical protein